MQVEDRIKSSVRSLTALGDNHDNGDDELTDQVDRTAHGQAVTSRALNRLRSRGWLHLDDLHWPGRPRAVIDHVTVGPGGIVVVTTVHWIGRTEVRAGRIHHNGRPSAAQRACEDAAAAVLSVLPPDLHPHVVPALSVVSEQPLDSLAGTVVACSADELEAVLTRRPAVLDERDVGRTAALLWGTLSVGAGRRGRLPASAKRPNVLTRWVRRGFGRSPG